MEDPEDTRWGWLLRVQVLINLHQPLRRGILVRLKNSAAHWVYFKYKRLFIFVLQLRVLWTLNERL